MIPNSLFKNAADIIPKSLKKGMKVDQLLRYMGNTSFEARNAYRGAELYKKMILDNDVIWWGIAGAGIAGGMGGMVISLLEAGFIDVICSTGAQVYHDLHFAFNLPVKAIQPNWDDNQLRQHGDTRIYDIGVREIETLQAQDKIIQQFIQDEYKSLSKEDLASWEFNYLLGKWCKDKAKYPQRSFVVKAYDSAVPIFWDSLSNHSIAMNLTLTDKQGYPVKLSAQKDIFDSAALTFSSGGSSFVELGGGGPKNFIQQTGPTINQILSIEFEGAERGLQIGTAVEREGSLSGCTFGEAVTWGKYREDNPNKLIQIWAEYSIVLPLLAAYVLDQCPKNKKKKLSQHIPEFREKLENAR
jgi:deoxyhypusine synthase